MAKQELYLSKPLLNAPGFLGFYPNTRALDTMARFDDWGGFGGFITDPISWHSRSPAADPIYTEVDGQVLLHNGLPNRGFRAVVKAAAPKWARSPLPIIPSLIESDPNQTLNMVRVLEGMENLAAINIMPAIGSTAEIHNWLTIISHFNAELPIILTLPAGWIGLFGGKFIEADIAAILPAPPRGAARQDSRYHSGRLYGPTRFSECLEITRECKRERVPFIAAGGIDTPSKVDQVIIHGALAAVIDNPLWQ